MLGVWAAWALTGFGYPSAPLPIALNIASKILAFVTAFTLFLPQRPAPGQAPQPENNQQAHPPAGRRRAYSPAQADMTPPPGSGGQTNPFGMLPLVDAGPCLGPQTRITRMRPPSARPGMRTRKNS
jgi:hypothetical protein